jgi:hypothetical protein
VYESFHGCIDFLLVARVISCLFKLFSLDFRARLIPPILSVWVRIFLRGSWRDDLCNFVLDHDLPNSEFGLRFEDYSWNRSFLCELGRTSIPGNLVGLRALVFVHSIP